MQANRLYLKNHRHRTITRPFSGLLWQQIDQLSKSEQKNTLTYSMKKENVVCTSTQRRRLNGFVNDLIREFPMEYSVELKRLIDLEMEGSVG